MAKSAILTCYRCGTIWFSGSAETETVAAHDSAWNKCWYPGMQCPKCEGGSDEA